MMRNNILLLLTALTMCACQNDDTDFSAYINGTNSDVHVISISYEGTSVTVSGDDKGFVTADGTDVTVNSGTSADSLLLVLSGNTDDGSLLVYGQKSYGMVLNGISISNNDGPAINNQCGKALYMKVTDGTSNSLTDGNTYADITDAYGNAIDQKGALFSEGEVYVSGGGSLTVNGNCRHGFACDDYIVINDEVSLSVNCTTGNGIKVNDGIWINGGTLDINVTADAARGIRCDSVVVITGGNTAITTSGNCVYDSEAADYSSAACIKCDYPFTMTGGTLTMSSSGDGGKGLNCSADILFEGGTLLAVTTGGNKQSKPKAVKSDTGIYISGGSFTAKVNKSWACDNGYDDDSLSDEELAKRRVTVTGTPSYADITQKSVVITF